MNDSSTAKPHARNQSLISPALTRIVMWIMVLAAAAWTLQHIKTTLTIFGMAFLIAYLLNSLVLVLERKYKMHRGRAIALVYVSLFLGAGTTVALFSPLMVNQVDAMVAQLPGLPAKMNALATHAREDYLSRLPEQYQEQLKESVASNAASAAEAAKSLLVHLRNFVLGLLSAAFLIFTAVIVSIFVMLRWYELAEGVLGSLPDNYRQEIRNLGFDLHKIFGGYLRATITLATSCGALTLVVLLLHSLVFRSNPYVLVISCIAMLAFPIPLVNQVVPPISAAILGFINTDDSSYALQLAAMVYIVNVIIERTIAPRIMSEAVGVSPLFVLFAAFSGAELLGPVGALLGVPLAAMVKSIFVWFHFRFLTAQEEAEEEAQLSAPDSQVGDPSLESLPPDNSEFEKLKKEVEELKLAVLSLQVTQDEPVTLDPPQQTEPAGENSAEKATESE